MNRSTDPLLQQDAVFPGRDAALVGRARILVPAEWEAPARAAAQGRHSAVQVVVYASASVGLLEAELARGGAARPVVVVLRPGEWNEALAGAALPPGSPVGPHVRILVAHPPTVDGDPVLPAGGHEHVAVADGGGQLTGRIGQALDDLERERLREEAEAEAEYWRNSVDQLNQIGVALSTERILARLLNLIVQKAREMVCADAGSLYMVVADGPEPPTGSQDLTQKRMRFEVAQNDSVPFPFRSAVMEISKRSIYGYAALTQQTVVLDDVYKISAHAEYTWGGRPHDTATRYRTKSMLAVPLVDRSGNTIGVLQLINRKQDAQVRLAEGADVQHQILPFAPHDVRLAQSIASQASIAIQNALLAEAERNRLQGLVAASEQRFQHLIEGSIQGVAIYRGLQPLFANHAYARILGYGNVAELLASFSFEETFPHYEASRVRALEKESSRDGSVQRVYEVQAARRDGQSIWLACIARYVAWDGGGAVQVTVSDITSRKAAELKLKASEERFRNLVEGSIQGFVIHRKGEILFANDALARIFGFSSSKDLTAVRGWGDLISPHDRTRVVEYNQARLDGQAAPARYEFQGVHFNSGALWLEVAERVVEWDGDSAIQGILNDVTERKRADAMRLELERQIQHRQKLESLGVLAGGLAHDFNNMLTGILGNAELAALELPEDNPVRAFVARIVSASQRASHLTRQMLAYAGKGKVRAEPIDINTTIEELRDLLQATIPKPVKVTSHLGAGLPHVEGDLAQIEQVIMNLITNAAEAIGDKEGEITITTAEMDLTPVEVAKLRLKRPLAPGRYVGLIVSDTGCGMTEEVRARIFEPFFTTKFTGRGLGMSAVLGIVRSHKGAIDVETEAGAGSTFRVYLPAMAHLAPELQAPAALPGEGLIQGIKGSKALVIDDEPVVRQVLHNMLESLGFTVSVAESGGEALEWLKSDPGECRMAFLDMTMPGMQPEETLRRIRQLRPDLPVILCSGYVGEQSLKKFAALQHDGFLAKPFDLAHLVRSIETVLAAPRPRGAAANG